MIYDFINFINKKKLLKKDDKVLLAISGGIDSMVMLHLFMSAGYQCGVAHCNFRLRSKESDGDADFVGKIAEEYNIPFHCTSFDTEQYAKQHSISIQMAARELRYQWFEEVRLKHKYNYTAVAHHKDDVIETFHINMLRGTGIRGLSGIKEKKGNVIRPLLFANRNDINTYAQTRGVDFREDSSNAKTKYSRNKIRHIIIPAFKEIKEGYTEQMIENINKLAEIEQIYLNEIEQARDECVKIDNEKIYIDITKLKKLKPLNTYLYEFARPYNFSSAACRDIATKLDAETGKQFISNQYLMIKDRNKLIIRKFSQSTIGDFDMLFMKENETKKELHIRNVNSKFSRLSAKIINIDNNFRIDKNPQIAFLDLETIKFPLKIRKWKNGDFFYPLGMNKKKKISDFFIDNKLSLVEKEEVLLLTSENDILWVIGMRIDNRFKIKDKTKKALVIDALASMPLF